MRETSRLGNQIFVFAKLWPPNFCSKGSHRYNYIQISIILVILCCLPDKNLWCFFCSLWIKFSKYKKTTKIIKSLQQSSDSYQLTLLGIALSFKNKLNNIMHQCSNFFNETYFWYFWHFHSRNSLARTTWTLTFLWEKFGTWRNKICLCDFFACKKTFILYWVELLLVAVRINGYEPELHWTCNQMFCRLVVTMANKQIVKQIKKLVVEPTTNC